MRSRCRGQQTSELAAALVVLILCVFVPLIDLGVIPIRYGLASANVNNYAVQLSRLERLSDVFSAVQNSGELETSLTKIGGVKVKEVKAALQITSVDSANQLLVTSARTVPAAWLPEGGKCPCHYALVVTADTEISPLVTAPVLAQKVAGLNAPFSMSLSAQSTWENLGRNPSTGEYFLNE